MVKSFGADWLIGAQYHVVPAGSLSGKATHPVASSHDFSWGFGGGKKKGNRVVDQFVTHLFMANSSDVAGSHACLDLDSLVAAEKMVDGSFVFQDSFTSTNVVASM